MVQTADMQTVIHGDTAAVAAQLEEYARRLRRGASAADVLDEVAAYAIKARRRCEVTTWIS